MIANSSSIMIIAIATGILLLFTLVGIKGGAAIKTIATLKLMNASKKLADANYRQIKVLLKDAKPLVRLRFRLLVGAKRFTDYTFNG